jgi:hypothetical protein
MELWEKGWKWGVDSVFAGAGMGGFCQIPKPGLCIGDTESEPPLVSEMGPTMAPSSLSTLPGQDYDADMADVSISRSPHQRYESTGSALYWNNGVLTQLSNSPTYSAASQIVVSGTDVYVAGTNYLSPGPFDVAGYWKNGVFVSLTDGKTFAEASSIAVVQQPATPQ